MKAILALTTISVALPISAQVGTSPGTAVPSGAPTIAGPAGAGTVNVAPGSPPATLNPGGVIGSSPQSVGRTFNRPLIGGRPPLNTTVNPNAPLPTFRFPPPSGTIAPVVTNTGIGGFTGGTPGVPEASAFPNGAPVMVGNSVGTNFLAADTNFPPTRALSINLPPGATVRTNAFGVTEATVPPPLLLPRTPAQAIGAPAGPQVGTGLSPTATPQLPPRNPNARLPGVVHPQ